MFNCLHSNNSGLLVQLVFPLLKIVLLALFWNALPDGHLMTLKADNVYKICDSSKPEC
jgi:hypothetical protein